MTLLEDKYKLIKKNFIQIDRRQKIEIKRDIAIDKFEKELTKTYEEGKKILDQKPWIEDHYNKTFLKEIEVVKAWFTENQQKQSEMTLYDVIYKLIEFNCLFF